MPVEYGSEGLINNTPVLYNLRKSVPEESDFKMHKFNFLTIHI